MGVLVLGAAITVITTRIVRSIFRKKKLTKDSKQGSEIENNESRDVKVSLDVDVNAPLHDEHSKFKEKE